MAAQFESPGFSIMVMTTIPFCLIGAFGLLLAGGQRHQYDVAVGLLMLVGTVVNNGPVCGYGEPVPEGDGP